MLAFLNYVQYILSLLVNGHAPIIVLVYKTRVHFLVAVMFLRYMYFVQILLSLCNIYFLSTL
jgi:hypothetical protein